MIVPHARERTCSRIAAACAVGSLVACLAALLSPHFGTNPSLFLTEPAPALGIAGAAIFLLSLLQTHSPSSARLLRFCAGGLNLLLSFFSFTGGFGAGPVLALCQTILGAALLLWGRFVRISQVLLFLVISLACISIAGHAYRIDWYM